MKQVSFCCLVWKIGLSVFVWLAVWGNQMIVIVDCWRWRKYVRNDVDQFQEHDDDVLKRA